MALISSEVLARISFVRNPKLEFLHTSANNMVHLGKPALPCEGFFSDKTGGDNRKADVVEITKVQVLIV